MNALTVFNYANHEVRTDTVNGEILFAAKDVCAVLGYANDRKAVADHCRAKGVTKRDTLTAGGIQSLTYINEGNLYRLITGCNLPGAEEFESWVFDEVIPTIRKTGAYVAPSAFANPGTKASVVLREARVTMSESLKLAKMLKLTGNHAQIKAIQITREKTGVDIAQLFDIKSLVAATQERYHTPTEIGQMLKPSISAVKINKLLSAQGFQTRVDGEWTGVAEHQTHWVMVDCPRNHVAGSSQALRWFPSIVPLLQAHLSA